MPLEPFPGQGRGLLERAGLLEQVRRVRHDLQLRRPAQVAHRFPVQFQDFVIAFADDQQGRRGHTRQVFEREIRSAAARHDCADARFVRCCLQRRRRAGAGAEESDRQAVRRRLLGRPGDGSLHAFRQERNLEYFAAIFPLRFIQQVRQQRGETSAVEHLGHELVARTEPTAARAMCEYDNAARVGRHCPQAAEFPGADGDHDFHGFFHDARLLARADRCGGQSNHRKARAGTCSSPS